VKQRREKNTLEPKARGKKSFPPLERKIKEKKGARAPPPGGLGRGGRLVSSCQKGARWLQPAHGKKGGKGKKDGSHRPSLLVVPRGNQPSRFIPGRGEGGPVVPLITWKKKKKKKKKAQPGAGKRPKQGSNKKKRPSFFAGIFNPFRKPTGKKKKRNDTSGEGEEVPSIRRGGRPPGSVLVKGKRKRGGDLHLTPPPPKGKRTTGFPFPGKKRPGPLPRAKKKEKKRGKTPFFLDN